MPESPEAWTTNNSVPNKAQSATTIVVGVVVCLILIGAYLQMASLKSDLAEARNGIADLAEQNRALKKTLASIDSRLAEDTQTQTGLAPETPPRTAAVEPEPRQVAVADDSVEALRKLAACFAPEGHGGARPMEEDPLPPEAAQYFSRSLKGMAEGLDLWRSYNEGELQDKEYDRARHQIRDCVRRDVGMFFARFWAQRKTDRTKGNPRMPEREIVF